MGFYSAEEPENHPDLPAFRLLEEALRSYPEILLLISHNREFRRNLTDWLWEIRQEGDIGILKILV